MPSMKTVVLSFLASVLVIHTACAFFASPASVSRVSYANSNKVIPAASRAASYKMRSQKSLGPLLMADGDAMEAAQATAKKLNDQAAALREAAASSEAEIRPPSEEGGEEAKASPEPTPEVRPEDQAPPQKISNDMKDRLRKELTSQGADPNKSAGNPILVVAAVIAVLVVAGGKGIFY